MLSKNEVKYIQSLCHKKLRNEEGLFIAEGIKLADEILKSGLEIEKVYAVAGWIEKHPNLSVNVTEITPDELERISSVQTPNQVLIIAKQKRIENEPVLENNLTLVLDGIQDPGNMGTIIRCADWFGITQIIAGDDTVDIYNPKVIQASMGSICRVNVWYKTIASWLADVEVDVYGALLDGKSIYEMHKIKEGLLVIGNEGKGIKEQIKTFITKPITIPRLGQAESLNAAVATGIILSHVL